MHSSCDGELSNIEAYFLPEFQKYEPEGMPLTEFRNLVDISGIPKEKLSLFVLRSDLDNDSRITWKEFVAQIRKEDPSLIHALAAKSRTLNRAIFAIHPRMAKQHQKRMVDSRRDGVALNWGEEDIPNFIAAYNCTPPPLFIPIITIVEVCVFIYYSIVLSQDNDPNNDVSALSGGIDWKGPLMYDPRRRNQVWRFLTYMLLHNGYYHLIFNCIVQIILGVLLEVIHKFWRVGIVYFLGVIAGSLAQSVSDPYTALVGASGGVYALIGAHFASIIMNWSTMQKDWMESPVNFLVSGAFQLLVMFILAGGDFGLAVYNRYTNTTKSTVGYAAHLGGFIAGILVGIPVLRNLEVLTWEKICFFICILLYILFMIIGICFNIFCVRAENLCPQVIPFNFTSII